MESQDFDTKSRLYLAILMATFGLFMVIAAPFLIQGSLDAILTRVVPKIPTDPALEMTAVVLPTFFILMRGVDFVAGVVLMVTAYFFYKGEKWTWPVALVASGIPTIFGVLHNLPHVVQYSRPPAATLLKNIPIFRQLAEQDLFDLARLANPKNLSEGEFLAMQGQDWPYFALVESGIIKTHKISSQGRCLGALRMQSGALFCSPTLLDEESLPATLEADKDCCLFLWHGDVILPYVKKNNRALWELSTLLVKRMRQASEIVEDLAFQPVASRVARLLLKQNQQSGTDHMERNLTLDEMATMVGTTPVMVCKIMSQFSDRGYLKVSRTEIEFIDRDQLKKIIDNN